MDSGEVRQFTVSAAGGLLPPQDASGGHRRCPAQSLQQVDTDSDTLQGAWPGGISGQRTSLTETAGWLTWRRTLFELCFLSPPFQL